MFIPQLFFCRWEQACILINLADEDMKNNRIKEAFRIINRLPNIDNKLFLEDDSIRFIGLINSFLEIAQLQVFNTEDIEWKQCDKVLFASINRLLIFVNSIIDNCPNLDNYIQKYKSYEGKSLTDTLEKIVVFKYFCRIHLAELGEIVENKVKLTKKLRNMPLFKGIGVYYLNDGVITRNHDLWYGQHCDNYDTLQDIISASPITECFICYEDITPTSHFVIREGCRHLTCLNCYEKSVRLGNL